MLLLAKVYFVQRKIDTALLRAVPCKQIFRLRADYVCAIFYYTSNNYLPQKKKKKKFKVRITFRVSCHQTPSNRYSYLYDEELCTINTMVNNFIITYYTISIISIMQFFLLLKIGYNLYVFFCVN